MLLINYENFEDAYRDMLDEINKFGYISSPRGRASKELIGEGFTLLNPQNRLIGLSPRKLNIFYALGNFLWVMGQSNDLEQINYYNPRGKDFSEDGKTLPAAYGKRIFDTDGINQFHNAIRELRLDKDSRRCLINIHMAQYDWRGYIDTSCTSDFQVFIRDNKLHMINHMRSQSAAMVMPYDTFLMTMIQEYMARVLGLEIGEYKNFCNSIHFYENELPLVEKLIESKENTPQMKRMPDNAESELKKLICFERDLRNLSISANESITLEIDYGYWISRASKDFTTDYFHELALILIAKAAEYNKDESDYKIIKGFLKNTPYQIYL